MITRISVPLSHEEREALYRSATEDMRGLREQARWLLRHELERRGFLHPTDDPTPHPQQESPHDPH
jgi:hypothetical protein